jgi:hypothetical protein
MMAMNTALETMQAVVETVTNQKRPGTLKSPPLNGPPDLDTAVADFANRLVALARFMPWDTSELGPASQAIVDAARQSFRYVDLRDPRNFAFPLQLALSVGTLMTQQGLRGLSSLDIVGTRRFPKFVFDVFEMFTDSQIFVNLEYRDLIEKMKAAKLATIAVTYRRQFAFGALDLAMHGPIKLDKEGHIDARAIANATLVRVFLPKLARTLATGALRSVCTMIVRPLGRVHFCAVTGGKVI